MHEDTSAGIRPTDHNAKLTVKEHVERGGFRVYKPSQFISTTRDLEHALRWVSENKSALAVVFTYLFDGRVFIHDLSQGYKGSSWKYDKFVKKHMEVLVRPSVNPHAVRVCSYDDLVQTYLSDFRPPFLQEMSVSWQDDFISTLKSQFDCRCGFCHGYGHSIEYGDFCVELDAIQEYESRYCYYCNERGHHDGDCNELALDNAIQEYESRYCDYCNERGHHYDDCDELALDNAIQEYGSRYCYYCYEHGHYDNECMELYHLVQ